MKKTKTAADVPNKAMYLVLLTKFTVADRYIWKVVELFFTSFIATTTTTLLSAILQITILMKGVFGAAMWHQWSLRGILSARPVKEDAAKDTKITDAELTDAELGKFVRAMIDMSGDGKDDPSPDGRVHPAFIRENAVRFEQRNLTDRILYGCVSTIVVFESNVLISFNRLHQNLDTKM